MRDITQLRFCFENVSIRHALPKGIRSCGAETNRCENRLSSSTSSAVNTRRRLRSLNSASLMTPSLTHRKNVARLIAASRSASPMENMIFPSIVTGTRRQFTLSKSATKRFKS